MDVEGEELDLYGDLEDFDLGEKLREAHKEISDLTERLSQSVECISRLEAANKQLTQEQNILARNTSSLMMTAKQEIQRKDREIQKIRKEKEDICFRRNQVQNKAHAKPIVPRFEIGVQTDMTFAARDVIHVNRTDQNEISIRVVQKPGTPVESRVNPFKRRQSVCVDQFDRNEHARRFVDSDAPNKEHNRIFDFGESHKHSQGSSGDRSVKRHRSKSRDSRCSPNTNGHLDKRQRKDDHITDEKQDKRRDANGQNSRTEAVSSMKYLNKVNIPEPLKTSTVLNDEIASKQTPIPSQAVSQKETTVTSKIKVEQPAPDTCSIRSSQTNIITEMLKPQNSRTDSKLCEQAKELRGSSNCKDKESSTTSSRILKPSEENKSSQEKPVHRLEHLSEKATLLSNDQHQGSSHRTSKTSEDYNLDKRSAPSSKLISARRKTIAEPTYKKNPVETKPKEIGGHYKSSHAKQESTSNRNEKRGSEHVSAERSHPQASKGSSNSSSQRPFKSHSNSTNQNSKYSSDKRHEPYSKQEKAKTAHVLTQKTGQNITKHKSPLSKLMDELNENQYKPESKTNAQPCAQVSSRRKSGSNIPKNIDIKREPSKEKHSETCAKVSSRRKSRSKTPKNFDRKREPSKEKLNHSDKTIEQKLHSLFGTDDSDSSYCVAAPVQPKVPRSQAATKSATNAPKQYNICDTPLASLVEQIFSSSVESIDDQKLNPYPGTPPSDSPPSIENESFDQIELCLTRRKRKRASDTKPNLGLSCVDLESKQAPDLTTAEANTLAEMHIPVNMEVDDELTKHCVHDMNEESAAIISLFDALETPRKSLVLFPVLTDRGSLVDAFERKSPTIASAEILNKTNSSENSTCSLIDSLETPKKFSVLCPVLTDLGSMVEVFEPKNPPVVIEETFNKTNSFESSTSLPVSELHLDALSARRVSQRRKTMATPSYKENEEDPDSPEHQKPRKAGSKERDIPYRPKKKIGPFVCKVITDVIQETTDNLHKQINDRISIIMRTDNSKETVTNNGEMETKEMNITIDQGEPVGKHSNEDGKSTNVNDQIPALTEEPKSTQNVDPKPKQHEDTKPIKKEPNDVQTKIDQAQIESNGKPSKDIHERSVAHDLVRETDEKHNRCVASIDHEPSSDRKAVAGQPENAFNISSEQPESVSNITIRTETLPEALKEHTSIPNNTKSLSDGLLASATENCGQMVDLEAEDYLSQKTDLTRLSVICVDESPENAPRVSVQIKSPLDHDKKKKEDKPSDNNDENMAIEPIISTTPHKKAIDATINIAKSPENYIPSLSGHIQCKTVETLEKEDLTDNDINTAITIEPTISLPPPKEAIEATTDEKEHSSSQPSEPEMISPPTNTEPITTDLVNNQSSQSHSLQSDRPNDDHHSKRILQSTNTVSYYVEETENEVTMFISSRKKKKKPKQK